MATKCGTCGEGPLFELRIPSASLKLIARESRSPSIVCAQPRNSSQMKSTLVIKSGHHRLHPFQHSVKYQLHAKKVNQIRPRTTIRLRESILNQTDFSLSLANHVISTEAKECNFVFSPLSIHAVLGLVAAGSSGSTRDQLLGVLKSKSADDLKSLSSQLVNLLFADGEPLGGPRLSFANGVWVDQSLNFKPTFKETVESDYRAASNLADFQNKAVEVRNEANAWAEKVTRGLIREILPDVGPTTRLLFANAVYFKGAWNKKFDASETKEHEFFLLNGTSINVPFMTSKKKQYIRASDGFKVLGLPYAQGKDERKFSMYFFLPDAKEGLGALTEKMSSESGFIDRHLPSRPMEVGKFLVPKFKISFGFEATGVLKKMGIEGAFSGGGLTEMVECSTVGRELYVSSIFHKACIEVNEEGTEAAAVTAGKAMCTSVGFRMREEFVADHPFIFVLREDTAGVVLFVGQVLNPLS